MDVFELTAKLTLDTSQYESGLNEGQQKAESFGSKVKNGLVTAGKVGAQAVGAIATASVAMGAALVKGVSDVASYGDNIDKMSQKMGLSAEAYQEWDAVMKHSGTSMESMQASMKTLANAAETNNAAFKELGITEKELANLSQQELFEKTIESLQGVEDTTKRTYLAGKLLGRGATELGALLNTSAEDTQAMRDRVHELGGVMSDEAVKAAAHYQDSLQDMQTAFSGLSRNLMAEFMPSITTVMDGLTNIFAGDTDSGLAMIDQGITNLFKKLNTELPKFIEVGTGIINSIVTALINNLPAIVENGVQIIVSLVTALIQNIPQIIAAIPQIIMAIVNGLRAGWPQIHSAGREIGNQLGNTLKSLGSQALNWGKDLIQNFINGIKSKISAVGEAVSSVAQKAASFLHFSEPDEGPLSNFHTFAPDMMKLFAEGIEDNGDLIGDAFNKTLGFAMPTVSSGAGSIAGAAAAGAREIVFNVTELIDGSVLARNQYRFNLDEADRHGGNLINAYA